MVASVLVAKDSDEATTTKQFDRLMEPFAPVEEDGSGARPFSADVLVDVTVAKFLIDRPDPRVICVMRHQLREQLPIPNVAQEQDDRAARAQFVVKSVQIFG